MYGSQSLNNNKKSVHSSLNPVLMYELRNGNPAMPGVFPIKVNSLNLEFLNQVRTFPRFYHVTQSKYEANRSRGSRLMIRHPNIQL